MLAHTLKNILELVPEALPLVKKASIDKTMPLDSKDSTIATALQLKYFEKVAYQPVDVFALEKVTKAVHVYGVQDEVNTLTDKLIKAAEKKTSDNELGTSENYFLKVAAFEGDLGNLPIKDRSEIATNLYKEAKARGIEASEQIMLYSGNGFLSKEAAVKALAVRFNETKNTDFVKIASAIGRTPDAVLSPEILTELSNTVCKMDEEYGLNFKGHNFYKEAFFTKEAAYKGSISVRVAGKDVPYESLERVGREKIAAYIGADVAAEMDAGPANFKNVVETLPLDLQRVLGNLIKNV
jgi:hypothetical protein